jgi:hypothetical protein
MSPRWRLILAAVALVGWLGFLGFAAATKSRAPTVSRAQAAAATTAVVAELGANPDGAPTTQATVVERLTKDAPEGAVEVVNLPDARGFAGPGRYLLLLTMERGKYVVVGQQRSPGNDVSGVGKPMIYPWTDDVRKQAEKLIPKS